MSRIVATAMVVFFVAFSLASTPSVSAQDIQCDAMINDTAGVFGSDTQAIEQAVDALQDRGPVVKVLTVQNFGDAGNLESYIVNTVTPECASWQPANGVGFKNNLIVFAIALDDGDGQGEVVIIVGDIWKDVVTELDMQEIQSHMGPRFADGDFVAGFVVGINEVEEIIDLHQNPPVVEQVQPSNPVVVEQSEPMDLSWLRPVLFSLIGLAAVVVAVIGAVRAYKSIRLSREQRRTAAQGAKIAQAAALDMFMSYEDGVDKAMLLVGSLASKVSTEIMDSLQLRLNQVKAHHTDVASAYRNLGQPAGDPTDPKLSTAEYQAIQVGYEGVQERVRRAQRSLIEFIDSAENLEDLATEAPNLIAQASAAIAEARRKIHDVASDGYLVNQAVETLEKAAEAVDEAQTFLEQKELQKVADWTKQATITAAEAAKMAANRPVLQAKANEAAKSLERMIAQTNTRLAQGREKFDQISAEYAESSWRPIKGNGSESELLIQQAQALLSQARLRSHTETQEWEESLVAITQAKDMLERAQGHLRSIFTLKRNLEIAKQTATKEIADAEMDVTKAQDFLVSHRDSVDRKHSIRLQKAAQHLGLAKKELSKDKPDYLEVVRLAQQANNSADDILVDARSEYDALLRLQAKAKSTLNSARIAVETADEYIGDHSSHTGSSSVSDLDSAKRYLESAKRTSDLTKIISLAGNAQSHAERAYEEAQASVRRHRQQEERRRRSSYNSSSFGTGVGVGIGSSIGGSSGSFGSFGSSSSFGGGGFTGSSSSFGGGGATGSSSKW